MDFLIEHSFTATPEKLAGILLDEAYQRSLSDIPPLESRELLSQDSTPEGTVLRKVRYVLGPVLPSGARQVLGNAEPAWVEEAIWEPEAMRWDWIIVPEVAGELLAAQGAIDLEVSATGSRKRVRGRVSVKIPLFGRRVERVIVDGLRRAYDEEAKRLQAWLDR